MNLKNCNDVQEILRSGATLLDVRTANEYNNESLPSAENIPLAILPVLAHERLNKDQHILIYCHSGARAIMAEKILAGLGFPRITNIGGMQQYRYCDLTC